MLPNSHGILALVVDILFLFNVLEAGKSSETFWKLDDSWSECSTECGPGIMRREPRCYARKMSRSAIHGAWELLDPSRCMENEPPKAEERVCKLAECGSKFRWVTEPWETCSEHCGPRGLRQRSVSCVYTTDSGQRKLSELDANYYCPSKTRPDNYEPCNRIDCSPKFQAGPWEKCTQDDPCVPGKQTRQVFCKAMLANGTMARLSPANCYIARQKPMSTWRKCWLDSLSSECQTRQAEIEEAAPEKIVQLTKEGGKIILQVGQEGYIIPATKVKVRCPVRFFSSQEIIWMHNTHGNVSYLGHSVERVRVDKSGNLLIENFRLADRGSWYCIAGATNSSVVLVARTPAEAFSDLAARHALLALPSDSGDGMMNEDAKTYLEASQSQIRWVLGPWSECSVPCGGQGKQNRTVTCEELQHRVYHVLDDQVCIGKHLPKPVEERECETGLECSSWKVLDDDNNLCTEKCLAPGKGSFQKKLVCQLGDKTVPDEECDESEKPKLECDNPRCQLVWSTSEWSQCSKSCGGIGVQSRTMRCIWQHDQSFAKNLCLEFGIELPEAVRACDSRSCSFDCMDLSAVCQKSREYCQLSTYRYHCCKSCRELMEQ